jgi:hypothetical protein
MKLTVCLRSSILLTTLITPSSSLLQAQNNLTLSSASVPAGGTAVLNLSLSSAATQPANLQWTLNYPVANVVNVVVSPMAEFISSGKTISCANGAGSYKCVTWGLNANSVPNGVIATVAVTLSGGSDAPVTISDTLGASAAGDGVVVTASGGLVSAAPAVVPLTISGVTATGITASGATINWTTNKGGDSLVSYGLTTSYGSSSILDSSFVTSHAITLAGLAASTTYHYRVTSRDAAGLPAVSGDFIFTTTAPSAPSGQPGTSPLLQLHSDASEVSGVNDGSIVTPAVAPAGFSGRVVVTPGGYLTFAPGSSGNGVYFAQCCSNTGNAYYKFTGAAVGSIFSTSPRQITFYVKSRQSFAQRVASGSSYRQVFDVRDNSTHVLGFNTLTLSGFLMLRYTIWGISSYYIVPSGTEEKLFGNGVTLKVTMSWDGSTAKVFLNDVLIKQAAYAAPAPSWTDASVFDYGAYEYLTYGGYDSCDDLIDEFAVTVPSGGLSAQPASEAPAITSLKNGADESAPAVCSPLAVATLRGSFLPGNAGPVSDRTGRSISLGGARVLVNGSYTPILYASSDQIDFLCPNVPPATGLAIAVETAAGLSNRMETKVEEASPGIFKAGGAGSALSIRATGINWVEKFQTIRPMVRAGAQYLPIESITADPEEPGVYTLRVKLPPDLAADSVPIVLEMVKANGRSVTSNPAWTRRLGAE